MTTETTPTPPAKGSKTPTKLVTDDESGLRLDRWMKRHYPGVTHGQLQKWLRTGQIRLDGKRADSSDRLEAGQTLRLPPMLSDDGPLTTMNRSPSSKARPVRNPDALKKWVLFEDKDVVILNKPAGLAVQGGTGLKENLDDSLMAFSLDGKNKPKLVHRLDRDTSGVLLIARNDFAAMKLAASFRSRDTQKIYWAIVQGVPKPVSGSIKASLIKRGQIMHVSDKEADMDDDDDDRSGEDKAKRAITLYRVAESAAGKMSFVVLKPLTGRTHQLRVHMAHIGCPIWGDRLYENEENAAKRETFAELDCGKGLHLHARQIIIPHPRKGVINIKAPLGPHMKKTWKELGFSESNDDILDDL